MSMVIVLVSDISNKSIGNNDYDLSMNYGNNSIISSVIAEKVA